MEEHGPVSAEVREVYARFGLAMYMVQAVERGIATLLATRYGPGTHKITRTQYDELLQSLHKRTFGSLVGDLRRTMQQTPSDFEQSLKRALEFRNWLTHHYFWERAAHFDFAKGRLSMVAKLQDIIDFLEGLNEQVNAMLRGWIEDQGTKSETVHLYLERLMQELVEQVEDEL